MISTNAVARRAVFLVLALSAAWIPALSAPAPEKADAVFLNGNVYTVDSARPKAQAVAVKDGKILRVGSNEEISALKRKETRVVDWKGATVVPGLSDAHCHLVRIGRREMELNLEGSRSLGDFLARVRERARKAKPGEWIVGRGWIETHWKPPVFPTRQDLDKVAPKNPVFFWRADGHGAVANSPALKAGGIDRDTPNPFGGEISKDKDGEPDGMLLDKAMDLVKGKLPVPSDADEDKAVLLGVRRSLSLGWTQVQDAGGSYDEVERYRKLYGQGKIKLRIYKAVGRGPDKDARWLLTDGPGIGEFGGRFTVRCIKVGFDGALGSRGAALFAPYADKPETAGFLIHKEEELQPLFADALRRGIQVQTHAIGDKANAAILDLYAKAFAAVPPEKRKIPAPRWRVEHAQIVRPEDIPRFAALGVIPSMQPSHAVGDLHFAPARLGPERLTGAYAWRAFLDAGSPIAGGSDAPVEVGDPMIEFYAAVARRDLKGFSGEGWHPEQAVSREEALKMFTIWPAFAAFEEELRGSIVPGKWADFTVLSEDILKIPEERIPKTRCRMTVIAGEVAYERKGS